LRRAAAGWVTYDLANTIFALGVVGLYFPIWLHDHDLSDSSLAFTEALAGAVIIVLAPFLGARTDHSGRRLPALAATTGVAIGATAGLATFSTLTTFALLALGLVGFHIGSAIYDSLLDDVSTPSTRGRISGLGVGIGYLGSFVGLGMGRLAHDVLGWGLPATFRLLAGGFLVFSIPCFVLVKERRGRRPGPPPAWSQVLSSFLRSWRAARATPGVVRFLVGRFLYTDAINTLIGGFLAIYVLRELSLSQSQVNSLLGVAITTAIAGGLAGGRLASRRGALPTLRAVLLVWVAALGLGVVAGLVHQPALIWGVGAAGGLALGATWSADRVVMLELSPSERLGEFYGLYSTVGRFATVVGPLVWALVVDGLGWGRHAALISLAGFVFAGWWVLGKLVPGPGQGAVTAGPAPPPG
jgi:UMF1 family MFS transporter